jgi:hypothetical protein
VLEVNQEGASVPSSISVGSMVKQNNVLNYWKGLLISGESENGFNKTLVPEFSGGIVIGHSSGIEGEKTTDFINSSDLQSIQQYVDLATRLVSGAADFKQTLGSVTFTRYGLGGEKVIVSINKKDGAEKHVFGLGQFCFRIFAAADGYLAMVQKFLGKFKPQQANTNAQQNVEKSEKQKEKMDLLNHRFKLDSLQQSVVNLKRLLKSDTLPGSSSGNNNFGREQVQKVRQENKPQKIAHVTNSLVLELLRCDQESGVQAAQEQARKMEEEAKQQKEAEAEERSKQRQAQRDAMEREKESRTVVVRKRLPGQAEADRPKPTYTVPVPETAEQIAEKKKQLKELREAELKQAEAIAEEKARKLEEKKKRKAEAKAAKEKLKASGQQPTKQQQQQQQLQKQQQQQKQQLKQQQQQQQQQAAVQAKPVVPKVKTAEDIANEKRQQKVEEQAEAHRMKKKQVQLTKLAAELAKQEAKKSEKSNEPETKPAKKEKPVPQKGSKKGAIVATKNNSNSTLFIGGAALLVILALFLFYVRA